MSPPEWLSRVCVGGTTRGFASVDTWTCARCLGMLLAGPFVAIAWRSRWTSTRAQRLVLVALLIAALANLLQHSAWPSAPAWFRAPLGASFGASFCAVSAAQLNEHWLGRWRVLAAFTLAWMTIGLSLSSEAVRGTGEIAGYAFMLASFSLACWAWVRDNGAHASSIAR